MALAAPQTGSLLFICLQRVSVARGGSPRMSLGWRFVDWLWCWGFGNESVPSRVPSGTGEASDWVSAGQSSLRSRVLPQPRGAPPAPAPAVRHMKSVPGGAGGQGGRGGAIYGVEGVV